MASPSIKGTSISSLIEDLAKFVAEGRVEPALVDERLTVEDRDLLDRPVNAAGWYDIQSYRRMAELLCEIEGRREDLLRERGAAAAVRLAAAGIYQQIDSVTRIGEAGKLDSEARFVAYGRSLKLIATLSGSILNFSRWVVAPDPDPPDRYRVEVHEARDFPEVLAHTTEGFINGLAGLDASSGGAARSRWAHERVRPDLLIFRMLDPVLQLD